MRKIPDLDRIDFAILRLLQNDARLAVKEVAAAVELAPSSVHERIKRLRDADILRGAHAEVDPVALGVGLEGLFMIGLAKHKRSTVDELFADIAEIPEVRSAFLVSGRYDLLVHVLVRDTDHLKNLAFDHFTSRNVVSHIETAIIFEGRHRHEVPIYLEGA